MPLSTCKLVSLEVSFFFLFSDTISFFFNFLLNQAWNFVNNISVTDLSHNHWTWNQKVLPLKFKILGLEEYIPLRWSESVSFCDSWSLGSRWMFIKGTDNSETKVDPLIPLMHHNLDHCQSRSRSSQRNAPLSYRLTKTASPNTSRKIYKMTIKKVLPQVDKLVLKLHIHSYM